MVYSTQMTQPSNLGGFVRNVLGTRESHCGPIMILGQILTVVLKRRDTVKAGERGFCGH